MKAANGQLNSIPIGRVSWSVGQLPVGGYIATTSSYAELCFLQSPVFGLPVTKRDLCEAKLCQKNPEIFVTAYSGPDFAKFLKVGKLQASYVEPNGTYIEVPYFN